MKFVSLQYGRAFSALGVVLYHFSSYYSLHNNFDPLFGFFQNGHVGVDFFFVLSGFVLMSAHNHEIGQRKHLKTFVLKRFLRIYPVYWIHLVIVIGLRFSASAFLDHDPGFDKFDGQLLQNFALLPASNYLIGPSWSLVYEVFFYSLFIFGFLLPRKMFHFFMFGFCLIVLSGFLSVPGLSVSHYFFEFYLGMYTFIVFQKYPLRLARASIILKIILGIICAEWFYFWFNKVDTMFLGRINIIVWAVPFCLVLWSSCSLELVKKIKRYKWLELLGNASFVLYISHTIFQAVAHPLHQKYVHSGNGVILAYLSLFFIVLTYSIVFHLQIEDLLLKKNKKILATINKK